ncbi:MAG TPA: phosphatase PAP2 family protein [Stellaceae bacterium]|jgi:membrane-associated phospholipid phosphatase|nr:phosphatase PAP2 family protein [Stellaceae bacterium]
MSKMSMWKLSASKVRVAVTVAGILLAGEASAQDAVNLAALHGLSPVSALGNSVAGKAALADNLAKTGAIQDGTAQQPTLLPFAAQQQQALRDAFITGGNAADLADGLGSRLGAAYQTKATYTSADDGQTSHFTSVSPAIAALIAYANATTRADARSGKYFFGNATTDKTTPVSAAALAIMSEVSGTTDIFGKMYGRPAGGPRADPYGNSRPFQTEPHLMPIVGADFFGVASGNAAYLQGPTQNLTDSPSYPSGHTTYGYTEALLLALMVPERYQQMIVRGAEYGNDRIIMGAHYTMDVLGGRTLALFDLAQMLANKPGYVGVERGRGHQRIDDFRAALATARADLTKALEAGCGGSVATCAAQDQSRFAEPAKNAAFYASTQTYGLATVFTQNASGVENVAALAPEAGYLLTVAFPHLTLSQADDILTATEGPGGGFLDNGSAFGVYSRLDLYTAAERAATAVGH